MGNWCVFGFFACDAAPRAPQRAASARGTDTISLAFFSADKTARDHSVSREDQDAFALASYAKAAAAWKASAFAAEIAPVTIPDKRKGDTVVSEDEEYKKVVPAKVAGLKPVFSKDGTVTAANASNLNDGASAVLLASEEKVAELGLKPLAKVICASLFFFADSIMGEKQTQTPE